MGESGDSPSVSPRPSWPCSLLPQQKIDPLEVSATECLPPAQTDSEKDEKMKGRTLEDREPHEILDHHGT